MGAKLNNIFPTPSGNVVFLRSTNKKYKKLFNLADKYYKKGREKDDIHHLRVAGIMQSILKEVSLDEETMMAAALLHDIGYAKIPEKERKTYWAKKVMRDHMKHGAKMARDILSKVGYPENKIKTVCQIIATHDNPGLGIPIKNRETKALKEADILWMTTEEAFWLDVKRRPQLTAKAWLDVLERRFTEDKAYISYIKTDFGKRRVKNFLKIMKKKIN
jgi:putative nucleotidyltransferase with HDIG domain